jgi:hypothetical protein
MLLPFGMQTALIRGSAASIPYTISSWTVRNKPLPRSAFLTTL